MCVIFAAAAVIIVVIVGAEAAFHFAGGAFSRQGIADFDAAVQRVKFQIFGSFKTKRRADIDNETNFSLCIEGKKQ